MTDSSIIQDARDVVAKWRDGARPGPWQRYDAVNDWSGEPREVVKAGPILIGPDMLLGNAPLIVGTAGNPELLDAIDAMLAMWADWSRHGYVYVPDYVEHIAAAIVAANERMSA